MSLPHLPAELQNLIFTNLHPSAALALRQTNHHYYSTVSLHHLAPTIVREFLCDLDRRPRYQTEDGLNYKLFACYECLCMKPGIFFEYTEIVRCSNDRQCLGCDAKKGRVIRGGIRSFCCDTCVGLKLI